MLHVKLAKIVIVLPMLFLKLLLDGMDLPMYSVFERSFRCHHLFIAFLPPPRIFRPR